MCLFILRYSLRLIFTNWPVSLFLPPPHHRHPFVALVPSPQFHLSFLLFFSAALYSQSLLFTLTHIPFPPFYSCSLFHPASSIVLIIQALLLIHPRQTGHFSTFAELLQHFDSILRRKCFGKQLLLWFCSFFSCSGNQFEFNLRLANFITLSRQSYCIGIGGCIQILDLNEVAIVAPSSQRSSLWGGGDHTYSNCLARLWHRGRIRIRHACHASAEIQVNISVFWQLGQCPNTLEVTRMSESMLG